MFFSSALYVRSSVSSYGAFFDNYALALAEVPTVRSHSIRVKCLCILAKNRSTLSKHNCQTYKIMSQLRLVMIAFTQRPVEFPYLFFLFVCLFVSKANIFPCDLKFSFF